MEQENSKSQQPESGQDEALAEGKSAETEPDAAPPQKKGLLSALKAFFHINNMVVTAYSAVLDN